ncbi:MAG: undecaprenyl-diphosphate phosphatase [Nitrospirae bacterium]|nr:MAG: undecaprenyl-diphosphate phosphatase [Nitrospirota bacterium]
MDQEIQRAIILGIVQGLTEFLPVSSTAHLILFPWFFGWHGDIDSLTFDVALHGGTLLALLVCFYKDWLELLTKERQKLGFILAAVVPAGVVGILFKGFIEHQLRNPLIMVATLTLFGVVMLAAEKLSPKNRDSVSFKDALFIGMAQAIALIPGVSRSGITITAGLFRGLSRESAARFSFLLSTPVIAGATLLECRKLIKNPGAYNLDMFSVGFLASFISGFFAIKFLLAYLKKYPLNAFVYYRFGLAVVIAAAYFRMQ